MNRGHAAEVAQETLRILEAGRYTLETGETVEIGEALLRAAAGTRSYPPEAAVPPARPRSCDTRVEVTPETTLAAARRLAAPGGRPVALNFASAKNPGGGFLSGARAQEESLARASGLYACLLGNEMYARHRSGSDALYTSYTIYSPDVPVFRCDEGRLLPEPYLCSFITAPAVNAKVVLERDPSRRGEVREAMRERIRKVLAIAGGHGHEEVVLGAWGCGVFGNDTAEIAELFAEALSGPFRGVFARVVFAIVDGSEERRFLRPFQRIFDRPG